VEESERGVISDFPVDQLGGYEVLTQRIRMEHRTPEALNKFGLLPDGFVFGNTFQLLDPHTNFPNDAMHCELRIAKYFHSALMEDIFTTAGCQAYEVQWNKINLPYGW
jgi:hypothetical protein